MAHTKSQGAVAGNRDSQPKRRGIKVYGGGRVAPGHIIVRQKGSNFNAGNGVEMGKDFTLFAIREGVVNFKMRLSKKVVEVING
ncbi:50S ribosomal protein L27 [soil metagenome]